MKATFTLLLLCQWAFTGMAQTTGWHNVKLKQLYVELGASLATDFRESGKVGDAALTFALSNGWGASYISKAASFKPSNLPADYQQGYFLFIPAPARNHITMNSININYNFNLEATSVKVVLSAGPALVTYEEHTFTHTAASFNALGPLLSSSNYMDHYITKSSAGGNATGYIAHTRIGCVWY